MTSWWTKAKDKVATESGSQQTWRPRTNVDQALMKRFHNLLDGWWKFAELSLWSVSDVAFFRLMRFALVNTNLHKLNDEKWFVGKWFHKVSAEDHFHRDEDEDEGANKVRKLPSYKFDWCCSTNWLTKWTLTTTKFTLGRCPAIAELSTNYSVFSNSRTGNHTRWGASLQCSVVNTTEDKWPVDVIALGP